MIKEITDFNIFNLGEKCFIGENVSILSHNKGRVDLSDACRVERDCILESLNGNIFFGNNSTLNPFSIIRAWGDVKIGNGVRIGPSVNIMAMNHNYSDPKKFIYKQGLSGLGITIGNNVWIGANVIILDGVEIGDNCIIGASSMVKDNIPSNSIAVGNPAVVKKELNSEIGRDYGYY